MIWIRYVKKFTDFFSHGYWGPERGYLEAGGFPEGGREGGRLSRERREVCPVAVLVDPVSRKVDGEDMDPGVSVVTVDMADDRGEAVPVPVRPDQEGPEKEGEMRERGPPAAKDSRAANRTPTERAA